MYQREDRGTYGYVTCARKIIFRLITLGNFAAEEANRRSKDRKMHLPSTLRGNSGRKEEEG
jgi:hypothetical protein